MTSLKTLKEKVEACNKPRLPSNGGKSKPPKKYIAYKKNPNKTFCLHYDSKKKSHYINNKGKVYLSEIKGKYIYSDKAKQNPNRKN